MGFKEIKSAKDYIETEYGLAHLIDIMRFEDTTSMLGIMQEFSNSNLKARKAPEMLEMLKIVYEQLEAPDSISSDLPEKIKQLIQSATKLKEIRE